MTTASKGLTSTTKVAILGTGAYAQGLCSLAIRSGAMASYNIELASRRIKDDETHHLPGLPGVPIVSFEAALKGADIVVLAIPAGAYPRLVQHSGEMLSRKIVIDICNPDAKEITNLYSSHPPSDVEAHTAGSLTNSSSYTAASWLQTSLDSSTMVVKALNNLSSYQLIHGDNLTEHFKTVAASNDFTANEKAKDFIQALGIECRTVPSLGYAAVMEKRHSQLLPEWHIAFLIMLGTWMLAHLYSFLRYNYYGKANWTYVIMWILNKSLAWAALWGLAYTFLPGVIVCYMQLALRRGSVRLPKWLKLWMNIRKQLGLISLLLTLLHLLLSIFLFMPSYYAKLWEQDDHMLMPVLNGTRVNRFGLANQRSMAAQAMKGGPKATLLPSGVITYGNVSKATTASMTASVFANLSDMTAATNLSAMVQPIVIKNVGGLLTLGSRLNKWGELSMLTGIIAGVLMTLTGLTSVPCITPKLNWREWRLLQPNFSWWCIIISEIHVLLLGAKNWPKYKTDWPAMIPTITLMSTVPIMALLLLKGLLILPPLSIVLKKIRSGKIGQPGDIPDFAYVKL